MIDPFSIFEVVLGFAVFFLLVYFAKKFADNFKRRMQIMQQNFNRLTPQQQRQLMKQWDKEERELREEDSEFDGEMLGFGSMFPPDFEEDEDDN
jgi:hypothetical protein